MRQKLLLSIFALLIIFIPMSGCAGISEESNDITIMKQFEGEVEFEYEEQKTICKVKKHNIDSCSLEITYPENLSGIRMDIDSETVNFEYNGLAYSLAREKMPESGKVEMFLSVIENLPDLITTSDENYNAEENSYEGVCGKTKYRAYFDENGIVTKLVFET